MGIGRLYAPVVVHDVHVRTQAHINYCVEEVRLFWKVETHYTPIRYTAVL
jgi:hypothetical protein